MPRNTMAERRLDGSNRPPGIPRSAVLERRVESRTGDVSISYYDAAGERVFAVHGVVEDEEGDRGEA